MVSKRLFVVNFVILFSSFTLSRPSHGQPSNPLQALFLRNLTNTTAPTPPAPLRMAKATLQINRSEILLNATTGQYEFKITPVCNQSLDLGLYDIRNQGYAASYRAQCADVIDGEAVEIRSEALFAISSGGLMPGLPAKDFKFLAVLSESRFKNPSKKNLLPEIPDQHVFSQDLAQKYVGVVSLPRQIVRCTGTGPLPRIQANDTCTPVNPLAYQVIWDLEDTL